MTLFDCDSTLSEVEGIDELSSDPDHQEEIAALTDAAMEGRVPLEEVYGRRLSLVNPTQGEVRSVKSRYKSSAVPDAQAVITALHATEVETWIISGGLLEPVAEFATWLGVPHDRVRAVAAHFDPLDGDWWDGRNQPRYAQHGGGELTTTDGKADIIRSVDVSVIGQGVGYISGRRVEGDESVRVGAGKVRVSVARTRR